MTTTSSRGRQAAPVAALDERALVRRARDGALPAFAELVRRFEGRLYNFLLRRTRSAADAEEITQETLVRAWQRLAQYDERWRFSTWLFTIGGRLALSTQRRRRRESLVGDASRLGRPDRADPAGAAADRETCRRLWDLADRVLPDGQRTALWLRYAEDLTVGEIAGVMGRTRVSVRVMLHRARRALAAHEARGAPTPVTTESLAGDLVCRGG